MDHGYQKTTTILIVVVVGFLEVVNISGEFDCVGSGGSSFGEGG